MTFLPDADRVTPPESADAERLMRGLANAVPGIMVYLDATLRCGFANRADLEWVGRSAETVVNRSVEEIFGHACAHSVRSPFDAGLRGEPGMIERSTPRPGGRWLVHQIRCIPDRKPSGQIAGVDVMGLEVTRLKEAESALRATNATLLRSRNEAQAATVATAAFLANMRHEIRTPMNAVIGPTHVILRSSHDTWQRERLAKIDTEMGTGRPQDVMLVDGRTAPLNGIEALQRLRDLLGNGMPPHAIVTAFNDEHFLAQTRSAEIDTVLVKPITASSLLDGLVRCLGTGAPGPAASPMDVCEAEQRRRRLHAGQRLLLAEDNPINQAVALELLRWCDLLVDVAGNGAQAVELAVAPPYDLALMDMQMPRLDGLEATRSIRQRIGHQLLQQGQWVIDAAKPELRTAPQPAGAAGRARRGAGAQGQVVQPGGDVIRRARFVIAVAQQAAGAQAAQVQVQRPALQLATHIDLQHQRGAVRRQQRGGDGLSHRQRMGPQQR